MEIKRNAVSQEVAADPAYFTGTVHMAVLSQTDALGRANVLSVRFGAGGRTNWHTHPYGQTLVITEGTGWVQKDGAPRQEVTAGDVVVIPAGLRHWHGATATAPMTHIAVQERGDQGTADWAEPVSDADYEG